MNGIVSFLLDLDYQILKWINQTAATEWGDHFFPYITDLHKLPLFKWIFLPLMVAVFIRKFRRVGITLCLFLFLAMGFNDYVGSMVKNHYVRLRPFENTEIDAVQKSPAGSKSFYSNHTSNMFTFATYTSTFFPAAKIPLFVLASTIGYSRIYNGVHYPSDVAAGAVAGIIWGTLFSRLARRIRVYLERPKTNKEEQT